MHVPTQLGTAVFTGTTLCVRAELSRAANVVWHVTESKVKTNTCLCVGNVSHETRVRMEASLGPPNPPAVSSVFGHFNFLFSIFYSC